MAGGRDYVVPGLAAAGGLAVAAVAAGTVACSRARHPPELLHCVVFLDSPATGPSLNGQLVKLSTQEPFACLQGSVCKALGLSTPPSLFVYDESKEQLSADGFLQQLQRYASTSTQHYTPVVPLLATEGTALSSQAASLAPLALPRTGPRPLPLVKHAHVIMRGPYCAPSMNNAWHNLFRPHLLERWGETVTVLLPPNATDVQSLAGHCDDPGVISSIVMTCNADIVGELLERQEDFPKCWNRAQERSFSKLASNGIFTSSTDSQDWRTIHGIFPKAFNPLKIAQAYHPIIVQQTDAFIAEWAKFTPGHLIRGVNNWLACFTADAVIRASCNLEMDNIARRGRDEPCHPLLELYREVTGMHPAVKSPREVVGWVNYLNPLFNTQAEMQSRQAVLTRQLQDMVADLQDQARRDDPKLQGTLLSALVNEVSPTTGEKVRTGIIFGHFVTLLVAGHETTANTMGFLMYYLSQHPEWEARLRAEIREVLGGRDRLAPSDLSKLVVAEACFKEALRLHPAAAAIGRDAAHDSVLQGSHLIRRGQRVQVNLVALHRNPKHWGGEFGDPNTFNPARFLPGAAEAAGRHPHAFKPFGLGIRTCVGMSFALWEAKTLLPMLYLNYTFKLVDGFKLYPSRRESFPTLSAEGLAFHIFPAPGAPSKVAPAASLTVPKGAAAAADGDGRLSTGRVASQPLPPAGGEEQPSTPVQAGASARVTADAGDKHATPLLVLFGSNSGTAEAFAAQVSEAAAAAGFSVTTAALDSVVTSTGPADAGAVTLPTTGAVLIITATYNGLPPDNAARFVRALTAMAASGSRPLEGVSFAVFGVGNSEWVQTFQAVPRLLDAQLAAAGASRLTSLAATDASSGAFLDELDTWYKGRLLPALTEKFEIAAVADADGSCEESGMCVRRPRLLLSAPGGDGGSSPAAGAQPLTIDGILLRLQAASHLFPFRKLAITHTEQLQAADTGRFTRHVELALPEGMTYTPGDHLEVLPRNAPALVATALKLLGLTGSEGFEWTPNTQAATRGLNLSSAGGSSSSSGGSDSSSFTIAPMLIDSRAVLTWLVDLSAVPSRQTLAGLAEMAPCPPEAMKLQQLAASEEAYQQQVWAARLSLVEVLARYRSLLAVLDLPAIANLLPRLLPRYYSIASSPKAPGGPSRAALCVAKVEGPTPTGRLHQGPASTLIHTQDVGGYLLGAVRSLQSRFRLPDDPSTPIIMVGPGTGIAPLVGFAEERQALQEAGAVLGPAVLFFGCRHPQQDYLYSPRLAAWQTSGVLSEVFTAFSRREGQPKAYVQDLVRAQGATLWRLLQQGARVYVCGDARAMAPDVRRAFVAVAQQGGGLEQQEAEAWLAQLLQSGRYLEDVWAG